MKKLLLILTFLTGYISVYSQTFEKTFDYWDAGEGNVIYQETDGYIMAGGCKKGLQSILFLVKTDLNGDTLWIKEYDFGSVEYGYLWIKAAMEDGNGNKYFALSDVYDSANFVKFDNEWNLVWKKWLDNYYSVYRMTLSTDGNILAVGRDSTYSYYISKINTNGSIQWRSDDIPYNIFGNLQFPFIKELSDSRIILIANWIYNTQYNNYPSEIRTYSSSGDSLSSVVFSPQSSFSTIYQSELQGDELISLCQKANDFISAHMIRHKIDGTIVEEFDFNNTAVIYKFLIKDNNKIITCGLKRSTGNSYSLGLTGYSLSGDSLWSSIIGNNEEKYIYSMKLSEDNGVLLSGFIAVNSMEFGLPYLAKTDSIGKILPVGLPGTLDGNIKVYPNPATTSVIFETAVNQPGTLLLYDATGRLCDNLPLSSGRTVYNTKKLRQGVYIYNIISDNKTIRGKLVLSEE